MMPILKHDLVGAAATESPLDREVGSQTSVKEYAFLAEVIDCLELLSSLESPSDSETSFFLTLFRGFRNLKEMPHVTGPPNPSLSLQL